MVLAHADASQHGLVVGAACVAIVGYAWAWGARRNRRRAELVWWLFGVVAMVAATTPPLERLAESGFAGHMVQHLLIVAVAAPAMVLAHPLRQVSPGAHPRRLRRPVALIRRSGWVVAPTVAMVVLYGTHLTGIYDAALTNRMLHEAEHLAYLGAGMAVWWTVTGIGGSARPQRMAAVLGLIASMALLGMILSTAQTPLYPFYETALGTGEALSDQRTGAAIMWVGGMALTLPLLILSVWRWASFEERAQLTREMLEQG